MAEATAGFPWWLLALGGGLLVAVAAAAWLSRRRHDYGHPRLPDGPGDACQYMRQRLAAAQWAAFEARTVAEEAMAEAKAEALEAADARARERLRRPAGATPVTAGATGFHLLDHDNPNASVQDDGRLGWFYPARLARVTAIVVHTSRNLLPAAVSMTQGVAETYAKAMQPSSVHALAGPDGVVEMLPDTYTAFHTEGANRSTLGLELVLNGDPGDDAAAVRHAADWIARRSAVHGIPVRRIDRAGFAAGDGGVVGHRDLVPVRDDPDEDFPWERLLELAAQASESCHSAASEAGEDRIVTLVSQFDGAVTRAQDTADRVAEARALLADATARVEAQHRSLWGCEARQPAHEVPQAPEAEAPQGGERWYLLENENPHAAKRENGKRGHYRPTRDLPVRGIVVHAGESRSAVAIADHLANVAKPASAHVAVDPEGWVNLLPDAAEAFHARRANREALSMVFAYPADDWGTDPAAEEDLLRLGAAWCRSRAHTHEIPLRRLTLAEWKAGEAGLIAHSDIDPGSGGDPGDGFPWDRFLAMIGGDAGEGRH